MKVLLVCFILLFLFTGCQNEEVIEIQEEIEINEEIIEISEEDFVPLKEKSYYFFGLFGKTQKEIIGLFEEIPHLMSEEEEAGIKIEDASALLFPEENIVFFFSEEGVEEVILPVGNIFLGFEIKDTFDEESAIALFGEPDERVFFRDRHCTVYYMAGGDVLFVKETDNFPMHVSIFPPPE
jgi:hypothetical protein